MADAIYICSDDAPRDSSESSTHASASRRFSSREVSLSSRQVLIASLSLETPSSKSSHFQLLSRFITSILIRIFPRGSLDHGLHFGNLGIASESNHSVPSPPQRLALSELIWLCVHGNSMNCPRYPAKSYGFGDLACVISHDLFLFPHS